MSLNTPQKVLEYIKRTGALVAQAEKQAAVQAQSEAAVSALIPDVVETMIRNGRISEDLREKAATQLADPARALEILASVAAHRTDDEKAHLGGPANEKKASHRVPNDDYIGAVRSEDERESSKKLLERFGIR